MEVVPRAERLGRRDARVVVTPHLVRREVRVRARAVPVSADRLRIQRRADPERLSHAIQQPTREPQLIGDLRGAQRPDLEFPLTRHDLGVDARDLESGFQTGIEVRLDDLTAEDLIRADAAVVPALRCREAAVGEPEWPRAAEERVFLLDAEPRVKGREAQSHIGVRTSHVRNMRLSGHEHDLAQDEEVITTADRIRAGEHRLKDAVGAVTRRLLRARSVEAPDRRLLAGRHDLRLRTQLLRRRGAVDPDVFRSINAHEDPFSRGC